MNKKRILAGIVSLLLLITSVYTDNLVVRAEDTRDITSVNYVQDEAGEYNCSVSSGDYGVIDVPGEGYHLIVEDGEVTAEQVTLAGGADLLIMGEGRLTCNNIQASDGAHMKLAANVNTPSGITALYDYVYNEETERDEVINIHSNPGNPAWEWMSFYYAEDDGEWYASHEGEPGDGPEPGTFCVRYDNGNGALVTWGDTEITHDEPYSFIHEEAFVPISLTFHTPEGLEKTAIEIRVNGITFYDYGRYFTIEDDYMRDLFGNRTEPYFSEDEEGNLVFSYTPHSEDAIEVEVIWRRGEPGDGPEPGTLCVRYDDEDGGLVKWGEAGITPNELYSFIDVENSTEEQLSFLPISLTFHTPEGLEKTAIEVRVNGIKFYENGEYFTIEDEFGLFEDNAEQYFSKDAEENLVFSYTPSRDDAIEVEVIWRRGEPGDGPEPGTLCVRYDDQDGGLVKWGETGITPNELYSFIDEENPTEDQLSFLPISLTFYTPEGLEKTAIEIRVNGNRFYENGEYFDIEDESGLFADNAEQYFSKDAEENLVFSYTPNSEDPIEVEVNWLRGDPGEGPEQIGDPNEEIVRHEYAYYVATDDPNAETIFKSYLATEIWFEYFNPGRPFSGRFDTIANLEDLEEKITLGAKSTEIDEAVGLYYYPYEVELDGEENAIGKAYILESENDFIVKTGENYNIVTIIYYENENNDTFPNDIYVKGSGDVKVFGNGTCTVGQIETESSYAKAWHVTQEHSGLNIGNIGCRLIVCTDEFMGIFIKGDRDAAAWNFGNTCIYDTGTQDDPAIANVYYGSDTVEIEAVHFGNISTITDIMEVTVDTTKLSAEAVTITEDEDGNRFTIIFNTGYDSIPLVVLFENGERRYVTVNRVGLNIDNTQIRSNTYEVWHGTDHTVKYRVQDTPTGKAVYATFYYKGDEAPTEVVNLFATIATSSGVERKVIDSSVTMTGTMVGDGRLGYASQGSDRYYDDFLIWTGTNEEYSALEQIDLIVYDAGDDSSFGGVKVGSGTGVTWTKTE